MTTPTPSPSPDTDVDAADMEEEDDEMVEEDEQVVEEDEEEEEEAVEEEEEEEEEEQQEVAEAAAVKDPEEYEYSIDSGPYQATDYTDSFYYEKGQGQAGRNPSTSPPQTRGDSRE